MDVLFWCWLVGLLFVLKRAFHLVKNIFFSYLDLNQFKYGWVVITGGSDGIGKEFAIQLHQQGFKVVLIARNLAKLEQVKAELLDQGPAEVEVLAADFSKSHHNPEEFYGELVERLKRFEVSFLINNVGVFDLCDFTEQDFETIESILSVNLYPQTFLSHAFIPHFLERYETEKKRSFILNLSSMSTVNITSDGAVYAASKSYNDFLSRALSYEYEKAIQVTSLAPGVVKTNMTLNTTYNQKILGILPVDTYVRDSLKRLGTRKTFGHWLHQIIGEFVGYVPVWIFDLLAKSKPKQKAS
mmetsp:Transcript_24023/g.42669  ORF Transcript_24023/g.42669 Transcript_24023/m.42669 type:complete len:299 (-) Transcript_24023:1869-2765(-)